jgi:predicted permease
MHTLQLALRRLASIPGFALASLVSVALGVGATSVAFGALEGLVLRPLPFTDGDRITWVFARLSTDAPAARGKVSPEEATAIAERMTSFSAVGVIGDRTLVVEGSARHEQWHGIWVTPGLFDVLDIAPAVGRRFEPADMGASGPPLMMLGYERWVQDFAADPSVVGRVIAFADNKRFTVIGVLPRGLEFPMARPPESGNGSGFTPGLQDFWLLGQDNPKAYPGGALLGRLAEGASREQAVVEARTVAAALARDASAGAAAAPAFDLVTLRDHVLGPLAPALPLLQAFAALVLLIAAANLANLMFVRAIGLERDSAIRLALGAGRGQLTTALLAESAVICAAGGVSGLGIAWTVQQWLKRSVSAYPAIAERLEISGLVLLVACVLCVVIAIACAVGAAAARSRLSPAALLGRNDTRQTAQGSLRWRSGLVVTQVALTLVLLAGAGVLRQSLVRLMSVDMGFDREHVVTADVLLYLPGPAVRAFFGEVRTRLRAIPGVEAVGLVHSTPLTGKWTFEQPFAIEGTSGTPPSVPGNFVAFDYFVAMGIPVLAGRAFTDDDLDSPDAPIVINDVAAWRFFPGQNPLGRRVILDRKPREIVGVVGATRDVGITVPAAPQLYEPALFGGSQIVVRVQGDPSRYADTLGAELLAADPRVIVKAVTPLDAIVAQQLLERRMISRVIAGFAITALLLAMAGLYGVTHLAAVQRRHEFGLRAALGARPADLLRMVLRQGLVLAGSGIAIGTAGALAGAHLLRNVLFETSPTDATAMGSATLLVLLVSAAACLAPAWKAAATDPAETLRQQ